MVSSTVYGIEELLDRVYLILTTAGYEVWMSHKGTMPVFSNKTALENCLSAAQKCDLFLGIITSNYGSSGFSGDEVSFTHQEMLKARELNKPRWILAQDQVVFARQILKDLGYKDREDRKKLKLKNKSTAISDLRVIDMYEDMILDGVDIESRKGNWVQKYKKDEEALLFATAQFGRYNEVELFIEENINGSINLLRFKEGGE